MIKSHKKKGEDMNIGAAMVRLRIIRQERAREIKGPNEKGGAAERPGIPEMLPAREGRETPREGSRMVGDPAARGALRGNGRTVSP